MNPVVTNQELGKTEELRITFVVSLFGPLFHPQRALSKRKQMP